MTQSIFDPSSPQVEHSGSRNLGPLADNDSHMPPDVVDGVVSDEEAEEQEIGAEPVTPQNDEPGLRNLIDVPPTPSATLGAPVP